MSNTFYDAVRFTAASAGTGDFVVNTAVQGFRTPAAAGVPNSASVSLRAESADLSEWEESQSVYTSSGTSFTRVVTENHLGTTAKINFTAPPQVAIVLASSDIADAGKFSTGTVPTARLPVGTSPNDIVQLDGSGKLPAVDGSALTNISIPGGSNIGAYIFGNRTGGSTASFGSTYAGSSVQIFGYPSGSSGETLSGTWMCQGYIAASGDVTIFKRIA